MLRDIQIPNREVNDRIRPPRKRGFFVLPICYGLDRPTLSVSAKDFNQSLDILYIPCKMVMSGLEVFRKFFLRVMRWFTLLLVVFAGRNAIQWQKRKILFVAVRVGQSIFTKMADLSRKFVNDLRHNNRK